MQYKYKGKRGMLKDVIVQPGCEVWVIYHCFCEQHQLQQQLYQQLLQ